MAIKLLEYELEGNDDQNNKDKVPPIPSLESLSTATVLNNHYDTDGVCSVWSLLVEPHIALKYKSLLIEAAESGDLSEWTSDEGLKLDLSISEYYMDDEEQAYKNVLEEMPSLLEDMITTGGAEYEHLWKEGYESIVNDWQNLQNFKVRLENASSTGTIVIVHEASQTSRISSYALHRGLTDQGLWGGTTRILRANQKTKEDSSDAKLYRYCYEKVGHGWVNKLVDRHIVPDVDAEKLVDKLNAETDTSAWVKGGPSGLTSICQTSDWTACRPDEIVRHLSNLDSGCC
jgi:hypothetical protein